MTKMTNRGFFALFGILIVIVVYEWVAIINLLGMCEKAQKMADYWIHQQDSTFNENSRLRLQVLELKDSIETLNNDNTDN